MQGGVDRRDAAGRWRLQAGCAAWAGAVCGLDSGVFATAVSLVGEKTGWTDLAISTLPGSGSSERFLRQSVVGSFLLVTGILLGAVCVLGCRQPWVCFASPGALSAGLALLLVRLPEDEHAESRRMARVPMSALLKSRGVGLALAIGVLVPLSGIGPVLDYSVTLFKRAGLDGLGANGVDILITGFLPLTTAFGLSGGYMLLAFFAAMLFFVSVFGLKETKGRELG